MNVKLLSRVCLGLSGLIFALYLGNRVSESSVVPVDFYVIPAIEMFGLMLLMSALVGVSLMIEGHLLAS